MIKTNDQKQNVILSLLIMICGLLYIFAYQFSLPFRADVFLYGMLAGLFVMLFLTGKFLVTKQFVLFLFIDVAAFLGVVYTSMKSEGLREAILFAFFSLVFLLSSTNKSFVSRFVQWIYWISVLVVASSIVHFIIPDTFNNAMGGLLRVDAYEQLMWSYTVDHTYAGVAAYTPNTAFSATVVFAHSVLAFTKTSEPPIIKSKFLNGIFFVLSLFAIILCSKRGIFVAVLVGVVVFMYCVYRKNGFFKRLFLFVITSAAVMLFFYYTSETIRAFIERFFAEDFTGGRNNIYKVLWDDFWQGNILIGKGTGAAYGLARTGAHNIYLQILYDHGFILSIPYYIFLIFNYRIAWKSGVLSSIFVQTVFLVYGLSGNPLYSNMFMIMYIFYVLYASNQYWDKLKKE